MTNSFSDDTKKVISNARVIAQRYRHDYISTLHVLLGMLAYRLCNAVEILEDYLEIDIDKLSEVSEKSLIPDLNKTITGPLPFTAGTKRMMEYATKLMLENEDEFVETFHLLQGIVNDPSSDCAQVLKTFGVTIKTLKNSVDMFREEEMTAIGDEDDYDDEVPEHNRPAKNTPPPSNSNNKNTANKKIMLDQFARNLNELAQNGKLDPVIGREEELERMIHILCRRTKHNPIITGVPGCVTGGTKIKIRRRVF
jgi:ATP-dependent Clp protease ATP-binding subunit ClpC